MNTIQKYTNVPICAFVIRRLSRHLRGAAAHRNVLLLDCASHNVDGVLRHDNVVCLRAKHLLNRAGVLFGGLHQGLLLCDNVLTQKSGAIVCRKIVIQQDGFVVL